MNRILGLLVLLTVASVCAAAQRGGKTTGRLMSAAPTAPAPAGTASTVVTSVAGIQVRSMTSVRCVVYTAALAVDADGAYRAYHPSGKGLDNLGNAGHSGNWWGIVTDNGKASGKPIIQKAGDPFPGFYVSSTSLQDPTYARTNPKRYVDAETVPFIVLPGGKLGTAKLGDYAMIFNTNTKQSTGAIVADSGPRGKLGEVSIATATAMLGAAHASPKNGGTGSKIIRYVIFPGSGNGSSKGVTAQSVRTRAAQLFNALTPAQQKVARGFLKKKSLPP